MKKMKIMKSKLIIGIASVFVASALFVSCKDYKDEHYGATSEYVIDSSLLDYIKQESDMSEFYSHIKDTDLETILSRSTSYTLFVPTNDAFVGQTYTDDEWSEIIKYHITNSYYTKSTLSTISRLQTILTTDEEYDGKSLSIQQFKSLDITTSGDDVYVNDIVISSSEIVSQSVVHTIDELITPTPSIWEWIRTNQEDYSYIYDLCKANESLVFDQENSVKLGFDSFGNDIYDEVYLYQNTIFDQIGYLNSESDVFTCGIFSDAVFDQATSVLEVYDSLSDDVKDRVLLDAIKNNIFGGNIYSLPFTAENVSGVESTIEASSVSSQIDMSNGVVYDLADNGLEIDFNSYFETIHIEMEDLSTFSSSSISADGLIGGAVATPTSEVITLSTGEEIGVKRFLNNHASTKRIPFGVYIEYAKVLPIYYTVRWKFVVNKDIFETLCWLYIKEFKSGAGAVTGQYSLVYEDTREQAEDFNLRILDEDMNVLGAYSSWYAYAAAKSENGIAYTTMGDGPAVTIPFQLLRSGDDWVGGADGYAVYEKILENEVIYLEYDWKFDSDRVFSDMFYVGIGSDFTQVSTTTLPIYLDVDYVELIPKL